MAGEPIDVVLVEDLVDACGVQDIDNRLRIGPAQTHGSGDATNRTPPRRR